MHMYNLVFSPLAKWLGKKGAERVKEDLASYEEFTFSTEDKIKDLKEDTELCKSYLSSLIKEVNDFESLEAILEYLHSNEKTANLENSERIYLVKSAKGKILDLKEKRYNELRRKDLRKTLANTPIKTKKLG